MNYQHAFHAGNFADVFKHLILADVLAAISLKNKPYTFIDAHAGLGLYDLKDEAAERTKEYELGIHYCAKALEKASYPKIQSWLEQIYQWGWNTEKPLRYYPGSPYYALHYLSSDSEIILNELAEETYRDLKYRLWKNENVHVHQRDAYELAGALLPSRFKRAMVLLDPCFEKLSEWDDLAEGISRILKKQANTIILVWYPIKNGADAVFYQKIKRKINMPLLDIQWRLPQLLISSTAMTACGMMCINPPFQVEKAIGASMKELSAIYHDKQSQIEIHT